MFFTYIWRSRGLGPGEARERFFSVLNGQRELYGKAFGREPDVEARQIGNIFIGQVRYDPGVTGWRPWTDQGKSGIAWGGVCENYLGKDLGADETEGITRLLMDSPERLLDWDGMFYVSAWDEDSRQVVVATAATECPTLWHTEGPRGWALGPRAAPLLELAGHKTEPDIDALGLYLLFGYLAGDHSPFRHVSRVPDRQRIIIGEDTGPVFSTYATLREYLDCGVKNEDWNKTVSYAADRLVERVGNQIRHSADPVVLLTGGRDSRSIAAAAKKTGYGFAASTGGPADSEDAVIAVRVARVLNVRHSLASEIASPGLLLGSLDRMGLWTRMTEGILPLSYSLHLIDFFESRLPFPASRVQFFHGLEPGTGRCAYYPRYPDVDAGWLEAMTAGEAHAFIAGQYKNRYLKTGKTAGALIRDLCLRLDDDLREAEPPREVEPLRATGGRTPHWFELLMWRQRALHWGMDLQSANAAVRWAWAPLFDRKLTVLSWDLSTRQKIEGRLLMDVSARLAGGLSGVPCLNYAGGRNTGLAGRIRNRMRMEARRYSERLGIKKGKNKDREGTGPQGEGGVDFGAFWKGCLLNGKTHIWDQFIDGKDLLKIIAISPQNQLLWRLLTIERLAGEFF